MSTSSTKTESDSVAELRKRIASAQHLIDVKQRSLPKLRNKLMWALRESCSPGAQQKFDQIYESTKQAGKLNSKKVEEFIQLLERTLQSTKPLSEITL